MTGKTHLVGGALAALGMISFAKGNMNYWDMATCLACCEFGSLLPDIDTESKITETDVAFKAVSIGLRGAGVRHRGITHTIPACLGFGVLCFLVAQIMVGLLNSSAAFLLACIVFVLIHTDSSAYGVKRFGSIIALGIYIGLPILMNYLPKDILSSIPTVPVKISPLMVGLSVFWGCISHLVFDTCNPQGIMWLWPISKKRFSIMPITTSTAPEMIFMTVVSVLAAGWVFLLYTRGVFALPF